MSDIRKEDSLLHVLYDSKRGIALYVICVRYQAGAIPVRVYLGCQEGFFWQFHLFIVHSVIFICNNLF